MMAATASAGEPPSARDAVGGDRRAALLDAAVARFVAVGIAKTTMQDISREAGAGKATLYRHFPNKQAVIEALVERESRRFVRRLRHAAQAAETHAQAVEDAFVAALAFLRTHPMLNKSLAEEPEILLPYLTLRTGPVARSSIELFAELIDAGCREGAFRALRVEWAAETLFRLLMSFFTLPAMTLDIDDPEQVRDYAHELVASGFGCGDPPGCGR